MRYVVDKQEAALYNNYTKGIVAFGGATQSLEEQ